MRDLHIVTFFDRLHTSVSDRYDFLTKLRVYSFVRKIIQLLANVLIPLFYFITRKKSSIEQNSIPQIEVIVSLTTFPKRINRIWIVIESLMRQTYKPHLIILWLSSEQFDSDKKLPKKLYNLQKRGLQIRFCDENLKSHKKYYYALKEFSEKFLITADDDIIYPENMIELLINLNHEFPTAICCHRARMINMNGFDLLPYSSWKEAKNRNVESEKLFFTSGGGTLFPPHCFTREVLNKEVFMRYCSTADDIWLNIQCRLNNTKIVKSDYFSCLLPVLYLNNFELSRQNIGFGQNDIQLSAIRNFYLEKCGLDAFKSIIR